jgi:hypothetical protein
MKYRRGFRETAVLGLQVAQSSLKGLAAGARDGLHTRIIGEAGAAIALAQAEGRDHLPVDALNKYSEE